VRGVGKEGGKGGRLRGSERARERGAESRRPNSGAPRLSQPQCPTRAGEATTRASLVGGGRGPGPGLAGGGRGARSLSAQSSLSRRNRRAQLPSLLVLTLVPLRESILARLAMADTVGVPRQERLVCDGRWRGGACVGERWREA